MYPGIAAAISVYVCIYPYRYNKRKPNTADTNAHIIIYTTRVYAGIYIHTQLTRAAPCVCPCVRVSLCVSVGIYILQSTADVHKREQNYRTHHDAEPARKRTGCGAVLGLVLLVLLIQGERLLLQQGERLVLLVQGEQRVLMLVVL